MTVDSVQLTVMVSLRDGLKNILIHFRRKFPNCQLSTYIVCAARHSRSMSPVVPYISLQLRGMSSGVISRRASPMYFFLCRTP